MRRKTVVITIIFLLILIFSACGSSNAGSKDENKIIEAINNEIKDYFLSYEGFYSGLTDQIDEDTFQKMGITADDYARPIFEKMSVDSENIEIDGNKATADVHFTMLDYEKYLDLITEKLNESMAGLDVNNASEDEIYAKMGEALVSVANDSYFPLTNVVLKVDFEKTSEGWHVKDIDKLEDDLNAALGWDSILQ